MSELLVGEDLEKEYRTGPEVVRVLRGASIAVGAGEVAALVGASGVGKSTLLHLLGALDRPTTGRVLFEGNDVFNRGEAGLVRYRRHQIGFVFQFYNLLGEMTALENTMIPGLLARRPVREARDLAAEALAEVGLTDRLRHRPGELSGGEQQRVAIARALMNQPRAILGSDFRSLHALTGRTGPDIPDRHPQSRAGPARGPRLSAGRRARSRGQTGGMRRCLPGLSGWSFAGLVRCLRKTWQPRGAQAILKPSN